MKRVFQLVLLMLIVSSCAFMPPFMPTASDYLKIARALSNEGNYIKAEMSYTKAFENSHIFSDTAGLYDERALVREKIGNTQGAIEDREKALLIRHRIEERNKRR